MQHLFLRAGPALIARSPDTAHPYPEDAASQRLEEFDLTDRAHEVLFENITLEGGTTLGDIFRLMERSPLLQVIFRRQYAVELCAEAREGPLAGPSLNVGASTPPSAHEDIECLELYREWGSNASANESSGRTQQMHLHGIGHRLTQDSPDGIYRSGECILWSVSLTPLREILRLPLKVNPEVQITEAADGAKACTRDAARGGHSDVTLGQVIHGLLADLSFYGSPRERESFSERLRRRTTIVSAANTYATQPHTEIQHVPTA
jgi:hypothetical protein